MKAHYPKGSTNYYLYTLFDGADEDKVAFGLKMEFVVMNRNWACFTRTKPPEE